MPATWVAYGVDGNHDGFADPFDPADAIPSTARMLCADGAGTPRRSWIRRAHNPATDYAVAVMEVAKGYSKKSPGA